MIVQQFSMTGFIMITKCMIIIQDPALISLGKIFLTLGMLSSLLLFTPRDRVTGGMAPECTRYHKRVAELISNKTGEEYSKVMNYMRTRVRFTLLKSTLLAIRGERGKPKKVLTSLSELSFNTVADMQSYEV